MRPGIVGADSIDELIAAIARLQEKAVEELRERRARLRRELSTVDAELAELTDAVIERPEEAGNPAPIKAATTSAKRLVSVAELIAELQAAPDRTINIRKANLDVKTIKVLAKAHPHMMKLGGKSGWPTLTLLERTKQKLADASPEEPQPELFD